MILNPIDKSHSSVGVNGFENGERVILIDDPFGIYHVQEVTRAGRIKVKCNDGRIRSVTATACNHIYEPEK